MPQSKLKYKRVILKISGEAFGENGKGISLSLCEKIAGQIAKLKKETKIDLGIVVGAGNIFRGRFAASNPNSKTNKTKDEFNMTIAHQMGMVATLLNGLALEECLENIGVKTRLMTALPMDAVVEPYFVKKALSYFEKGRVLILVGGTGNPYFTTDSAAALRACELEGDLVLKATNVDGIYDKDPHLYPNAKLYKKISFEEALEKNLEVMDGTAFTICSENKKPIIVFNLEKLSQVSKALYGENFGTLVE
ncbi:MAG TPA: UMP kinase [Candidatus Paceibacterota bacterium]|jgi:uridylate kinase|nr:UMP kinase [Candidatus Pacearchaeota archaeon]HRR94605.1 UMP kinase [Candidatus Paceibacterota bacterium]HRU20689.1 UMP kinase [Candidatus Paceibacterota bacterium]